MFDEPKVLTFTLDDTVNGQRLTLDNVDHPTLTGFLDDAGKLVKGSQKDASLAGTHVSIEDGSVKIKIFASALLAAAVATDMALLESTGDLDAIDPARAVVISKWQSQAQRAPDRKYSVLPHAAAKPVGISSKDIFSHKGEKYWATVEKYLTGKVTNLGGKRDPNVHIVLLDTNETITVSAEEKQLAEEKENRIYKTVTLHVQAEQHLRLGMLRNYRLLDFVRETSEVDEQALQTLWQKGRAAWRDVKSASAWVENLRGNT